MDYSHGTLGFEYFQIIEIIEIIEIMEILRRIRFRLFLVISIHKATP